MDMKGGNVAIISRDPGGESLRMAAGLTTIIEGLLIFIVDHVVEPDARMAEHIEVLGLMGAGIYTNMRENPFEYADEAAMVSLLEGCDKIIVY